MQVGLIRARESYPSESSATNIDVNIGNLKCDTASSPYGVVNLCVIRRPSLARFDQAIFSMLRTGVSTLEDFMGTPLVSRDVILHLEPEFPAAYGVGGAHAYSHIRVYRGPGEAEGLSLEKTVYHELAHYYLGGFGDWLDEGSAEFLAAYTLHVSGKRSLDESDVLVQEELSRSCLLNGIDNLMESLYRKSGFLSRQCHYPLGHAFMQGMYEGLGKETVSASLQELSRYGGTREAREERIYEVFQSHTPPHNQAKFRDIYARLHGLPPPGWKPSGSPPQTRDARALMALYNATDGPNWKGNHYWGSEVPVDYWRGVGTDANGRVVRLHLPNSQLTGTIPPELGNLSELESLFLFGNNLTGPIPPQLGNLSNLHWLAISENQLTGPIPPELGKLENLIHLNLGQNRLTGSIPAELGNLAKLRSLILELNQLTGCIPNVLRQLPIANDYLKVLGLPFC